MPSMINIYTSTSAPLFLFFLSLLITKISSKPLTSSCQNTTTYLPNSSYQANLKTLLKILPSDAIRIPENGFFNYSIDDEDPNNKVYSTVLCRGDATTDECHNCVATACNDVRDVCPNQKAAIIWYDICYLQFSNSQNILTQWDNSSPLYVLKEPNVTQPVRLRQLLTATMNELATQAASGVESGKKFADKLVNFIEFQKLYGYVQCIPDLSTESCNDCLRQAIASLPICCNGMQGGRVLFPDCNIRYELYFYSIDASPLSPPPPPPKSNSTSTTISKGKGGISPQLIIAIVVSLFVAVLLISIGILWIRTKATRRDNATEEEITDGSDLITVQYLQYGLRTIEAATDNFSDDNKIGEGGFGAVYKGTFFNGQEIAVKRLSKSSGQGEKEFKNEIVSVAKLQHKNLVRLLGFCLEKREKILIYEFVPNKSLDYFLFDSEKRKQLDWSRRYKIIGGIARGILYLHEDSRLRIIHRDLKASNILLDRDMNPKISDFGMARIFGVDQIEGSTNRIVGTFGYMSPEYIMHGQFSVKSDVFSFGVSVLEIISGKKNSSFYQSYGTDDLLGYAWKHWRDRTPLELMDPTLGDSYSRDEVIRCIHIGLLCVQEDMDARPSMPSVVHMLNSSLDASPILPQEPPFIVRGRTELNFPKGMASCSLNEVSISELNPR